MAATIETDLHLMRKLGVRLRTLAGAGEGRDSARLDQACEAALAEVSQSLERMLRAESIPATLRVCGMEVALKTMIASLLEHALAASPPTAAIRMSVIATGHAAAGSPVILEIAAPEARDLGSIDSARLDVVLTTTLPELRGDPSLVLAGAIADAVGGSVYIASDPKAGRVLALHLKTA